MRFFFLCGLSVSAAAVLSSSLEFTTYLAHDPASELFSVLIEASIMIWRSQNWIFRETFFRIALRTGTLVERADRIAFSISVASSFAAIIYWRISNKQFL